MLKFMLKEFMEESGMSIQSVSDKTGISRTTISAFYNEKSKGIQFDTLNKLVEGLDIEVWDLFENVFPKENLKCGVRRVQAVDGPLNQDEPTFEASFFYEKNSDAAKGITVVEFVMPLLVQLDEVNSIQSLAIFLSHEFVGSGWQVDANEHKLNDFLTRSSNSELEPYLISIAAQICANVCKSVLLKDDAMVIFKSDVGDFPEEAGPFPIIYNWPLRVLKDDDLIDDFIKAKYM